MLHYIAHRDDAYPGHHDALVSIFNGFASHEADSPCTAARPNAYYDQPLGTKCKLS